MAFRSACRIHGVSRKVMFHTEVPHPMPDIWFRNSAVTRHRNGPVIAVMLSLSAATARSCSGSIPEATAARAISRDTSADTSRMSSRIFIISHYYILYILLWRRTKDTL